MKIWLSTTLFVFAGLIASCSGGSNKGQGPDDTTPPTIVEVSPPDGAARVGAEVSLTIAFSEPMDPDSLTGDSIHLQGPDGPVGGTVSGSGPAAGFEPDEALQDGATYTATISTAASDLAGNELAAEYTWTFTVGATTVRGRVADLDDGPLADVTVSGFGQQVTSGPDGGFELTAQPGPDGVVRFDLPGYVPTSQRVRVFAGVTSWLDVRLMPEGALTSLDADTGGAVSGARGASLTAPADAFVDAAGAPVTGQVDIGLTPFDPALAAEALAYPGQLRGQTLDGRLVPLISFGLLDVVVRQNGQELQVAPGKTLDLTVPAPSAGDKPETSQSWYYDVEAGTWIEVESESSYDQGSDSYNLQVDHLTTYNVDRAMDPSCIYGLVLDADGQPAGGVIVYAQQAQELDPYYNRGIYATTWTDADGSFCLTVERDAEARLTFTTAEGVTTERIIQAGSRRSNTFPADCGQDDCMLVPSIHLDAPDPGWDNSQADCSFDAIDNPFALTCAYSLGAYYQCFSPEGGCTIESEIDWMNPFGGMESTITFDNGSRMESGFDAIAGYETVVYGPDPQNERCGRIVSGEDGSSIILPSGDRFTMRTGKNGGMEMECPGGFTFKLDAEQLDALMGCGAQVGDMGNGVACEFVPGSYMSPCVSSIDCNDGYECCGPPGEESKCVSADMCAMYEMSCTSDYECQRGTVCCSAGYFDMCLPPEQCL